MYSFGSESKGAPGPRQLWRAPLLGGKSLCFGSYGHKGVQGGTTARCAPMQPLEAASKHCSGCATTAALGRHRRAHRRLVKDTWRCCNGPARTVAPGALSRVRLRLREAGFPPLLIWLHDNDCPWDWEVIMREADEWDHDDVVEWATEMQGEPDYL